MSGSGYSEISDSTIPDEDEIKKNELESNNWVDNAPKERATPHANNNVEDTIVSTAKAVSSTHAVPTVEKFDTHEVKDETDGSAPSKSQCPPFEETSYAPDQFTSNGPLSQLVTYAEEFIYKTHPNSTAIRRHSTALIKPLFSRIFPTIKNYSLGIDDSLQPYISKFKAFSVIPKAEKETDANEVLSSACEVWFDFHKEPGYASVFEFQQELQNKLQNVIEPVKTQSSALKDKFTTAKNFTYSGAEFIFLHIQIILLAVLYWLNFHNWDTRGVSVSVKQKIKNPMLLVSDIYHAIRGLQPQWKSGAFWKKSVQGALVTSTGLLGQMLVVAPHEKRQKTFKYYVLLLDYTESHTSINKSNPVILSYAKNILLREEVSI